MKLFLDVFMIGVALSWGQCLAFCAPIMLPYVAATQQGWREGYKAGLVFSLARIIPYVILSLLSAGLGRCIISKAYESYAGAVVDGIMGGCLVVLGIVIISKQSLHFWGCPSVKTHPAPGDSPGGRKGLFLLGLLTGFAPCVPMIGLLVYIAFKAENLLQGALFGLAFGIGTLVSPLFLFASLSGGAAGFLRKKPQVYKVFSGICGLILLYFGTGMVMRVLF
ncbi:MAG: sulfite exporter TauE/SafE family protein [Candidatus Omnitrophota bacterium]